ncbi:MULTISPECIES: NlpC/P60 family protein [unclassified Oceanispirochaeta]|uniref:NlpC/P60 family protein n=1 Tax=unclassified Oceanispirochaeta TaxID=2635722 RepID=UPI001E4F0B07|nr:MULTISPECIES: NlpC/P60 family protein [unclassified Oceanispirochaeta]
MDFKTPLLTTLISLLFFSCASAPMEGRAVKSPEERPAAEISKIQQELVKSAEWALGRKRLEVKGRKFNMDCSGVVLAVYYKSGVDLQSYISRYSGGGVQRLYAFMNDQQLLYKQPHLAPGDMLFWDNSYDRNKDGEINDTLTHVGMVVHADEDGNIMYIHHNYRLGIVLAKMNLLDPDNLEVNSPMRAKGSETGHVPLWLSSHLLKKAARAYEIAE